jgi:hypothetical protein
MPNESLNEQRDAKGLLLVQYLFRISEMNPAVSRLSGVLTPLVSAPTMLFQTANEALCKPHLTSVCNLFLDCSKTASLYFNNELACIKASLSQEDHECAPRGVRSFHLVTFERRNEIL